VLNVAQEWPDPPYPFMVYSKGDRDDEEPISELSPDDPVVYYKVGFGDTEDSILADFLEDAFKFLEHVRRKRGRVLVHCVVGKSSTFFLEEYFTDPLKTLRNPTKFQSKGSLPFRKFVIFFNTYIGSAAVALGYLMKHHGLDLVHAYEKVKEARPFFCLNRSFTAQLLLLDKEYVCFVKNLDV
jgi:hypothetical protein